MVRNRNPIANRGQSGLANSISLRTVPLEIFSPEIEHKLTVLLFADNTTNDINSITEATQAIIMSICT